MTSAPDPTGSSVSPELHQFFQVEIRNQESMEQSSPATLGSAHNSLCHAPEKAIGDWFYAGTNLHEVASITHPLIEFGGLLQMYGDDALLEAFEEEEV